MLFDFYLFSLAEPESEYVNVARMENVTVAQSGHRHGAKGERAVDGNWNTIWNLAGETMLIALHQHTFPKLFPRAVLTALISADLFSLPKYTFHRHNF